MRGMLGRDGCTMDGVGVIGSMQHSDLESLSAKQPSVGTRDADSRKGCILAKIMRWVRGR
jgi:hypothetical protein